MLYKCMFSIFSNNANSKNYVLRFSFHLDIPLKPDPHDQIFFLDYQFVLERTVYELNNLKHFTLYPILQLNHVILDIFDPEEFIHDAWEKIKNRYPEARIDLVTCPGLTATDEMV